MNPSPIALAVAIAHGFTPPPSTDGWSAAVFRQVRRANLRTGYAGPKPILMQRVRRMFTPKQ